LVRASKLDDGTVEEGSHVARGAEYVEAPLP
jgi:hypothetical protein